MTLETVRILILLSGWPILIIGSLFLLYKSLIFYFDVNKVVFGRLVMIMTAGWLITMYSLGIVATVAMFQNVQTGVFIVLPIFIVWASTMAIIISITLLWSKEAVTINDFYQDIERKYQSIFEFSPEAILLLDPTGVIIATNNRLQEWLGYSTKDIVGKNIVILPFLTEESKAFIMKNFSERLLGKDTSAYQIELVNMKGARMFGQVVAATIRDSKGNIIRNLTMVSDVTERIKLEKLRDDLTNMIVHDLKNPLAGITGSARLLLDKVGGPISGQQKDHLEEILISGNKLLNLIMDLLQIKTIEDNKLSLNISSFAANDLLSTLGWINSLALRKNININTRIQNDLNIKADFDMIARVLGNLLSNAIKHSSSGGTVSLKIEQQKKMTYFEVSDSGEGIPEQYLSHIFEKFFKITDQKFSTGVDTGLGLAFCKMAVEAHHGTIGV